MNPLVYDSLIPPHKIASFQTLNDYNYINIVILKSNNRCLITDVILIFYDRSILDRFIDIKLYPFKWQWAIVNILTNNRCLLTDVILIFNDRSILGRFIDING